MHINPRSHAPTTTRRASSKVRWTCSSRTRDATPLPAVASKAKARPRRLHHGSSARRAAPPPAFDGSSAARGRGERPKARGDQVGGGSVTEGASPAPPVPRGGATCASERPAGRGGRAWTCRGRVVDVSWTCPSPGAASLSCAHELRGGSISGHLGQSRVISPPRWVEAKAACGDGKAYWVLMRRSQGSQGLGRRSSGLLAARGSTRESRRLFQASSLFKARVGGEGGARANLARQRQARGEEGGGRLASREQAGDEARLVKKTTTRVKNGGQCMQGCA